MFNRDILGNARYLVLLAAVTVALAGCSKKNDEQTGAPAGQVVARLGDQVVTVQELDTEFRWANVPADRRRDPEIVKRVLGELVTRKYLVQQALAAKLDREPSVLLDLLRAREQVLANAFSTRQIATRSSGMTRAEIDKFIADNPAKFADQQAMYVDQITVPLNANTQSAIDETKTLNSLDDVDQKLTSMGIPHNRSAGVLNSVDVPEDLLKAMQSQKQDEILFTRAGQNGVFLKIKGKEAHPIQGEAAVSVARQLLRMDMLKTEASMASVSANMAAKYEGDYAKIMADQAGKLNGN